MPLENDCFAYGEYLMPLDDGLALLAERVTCQTDIETIPLANARGRVLANDLIAGRSVPPHDNSAVDGFAVFYDDLNRDIATELPVTARITAGHPLGRNAERGEALRIFTGAMMPDGVDTIFMEEDVTLAGDTVILPPGIKQGANRRFKGEDIAAGDIVLKAGHEMRPQDIGAAASIGISEVPVRAKLKVAVFSTGDEVCDPEQAAPEGCVYDANRYSVMAMLDGLGCSVTDLGILPDNPDIIRSALGRASENHHLILTSGGVSRGEEDHVKAAVEALGSLHFWRLAIKPGRPIAFGQVGLATFIGLPGNPVATMVTFMIIARPVIKRLMGCAVTSSPRYQVLASGDFRKKSGRTEWQRAVIGIGNNGLPTVRSFGNSGAGILTSMVASQGLVELPEDVTLIKADDMVTFIPFHGVI